MSKSLLISFASVTLAALISPTPALAAERPNIILIMADDMGFSDIGCYGGEIQTPNLDRLAQGGVRLGQFYNTGRCCPTRASLLTGLYPHQAGIGHMMEDRGHPGYRGRSERSVRHDRPGDAASRLSHVRGGKVACDEACRAGGAKA